jgi:hypothetical protein
VVLVVVVVEAGGSSPSVVVGGRVVEVVDVVVLGAGGAHERLQIDGTFAAQSSLHSVSQQNGSTAQTAAAHSPQEGRSAAPASHTS